MRFTAFAARLSLLLAAATGMSAFGWNHLDTVSPRQPGRFAVACSNIAQDAARVATGASPSDYWEGRPVNGVDHYITEILANPQAVVRVDARVPDDRSIYPGHAGDLVPFVVIVCHPTPRSNTDADYVLPGTGEVIPHMQPAGAAPKLISYEEYLQTFGISSSPVAPGMAPLPLIVYSHGLTGSPISAGYVQVMVELAAQGFMVAAPFHGDPRFSRVRVETISDFAYLLTNFDHVAEMQLMRPLALKTMTDRLLGDPGFAAGIDVERIGGFGASLGGEAMALLLGARLTTSVSLRCSDTVRDPRIKAAVTFVPYAGYSFLPAFCSGQSGADGVNRPFLALSGTFDTTAPLGMMEQAIERFGSSRYLVELVGGKHEFRADDAGDLFTWMVNFLNAYLDVPYDPSAMGRFIRMNRVNGGREDNMILDVHLPLPNAGEETRIVEFHNTLLDHYLISGDPGEIDSIVTGRAGPGWHLTGQAFKGWLQTPSDNTYFAAEPVCRFYGVPAGGPNSHFYGSGVAECEFAKTLQGWFYEGIGFRIRPVANQRCPDGYIAVNRAYNNGWMRNDSNHRYSTSDSTMREMQRLGWVYEGISMCSRP
jgi:predicted dienelactone hydrolase